MSASPKAFAIAAFPIVTGLIFAGVYLLADKPHKYAKTRETVFIKECFGKHFFAMNQFWDNMGYFKNPAEDLGCKLVNGKLQSAMYSNPRDYGAGNWVLVASPQFDFDGLPAVLAHTGTSSAFMTRRTFVVPYHILDFYDFPSDSLTWKDQLPKWWIHAAVWLALQLITVIAWRKFAH